MALPERLSRKVDMWIEIVVSDTYVMMRDLAYPWEDFPRIVVSRIRARLRSGLLVDDWEFHAAELESAIDSRGLSHARQFLAARGITIPA